MSISKRCEVCGGKVTPIDDQSPLGSCDSCGIVYALKDRPPGRAHHETTESVELRSGGEPMETDRPKSAAPIDTEEPTKPFRSRWRCPDCGTVMDAENDSDLEFVKREHIREYHPNRAG